MSTPEEIIASKWSALSGHSKRVVEKLIRAGEAVTTSHKVAEELATAEIAIVQCRGYTYIQRNRLYRRVSPKDFVLPCAAAYLFEEYV